VCIAIAVALVVVAGRHDGGSAKGVLDTTPRSGLVASHVVKAGSRAPTFQLTALSGHRLATASYHGRPYVVTFWASWCQPCQKEMPLLDRAYHDRHGKLPIVGVTFQDPESDSRAFVRAHHISFPITPDDGYTVAKAYGVINVPTTFFVDAHGVVRERVAGNGDTKALSAALSRITE
jgi:cytochrome c biogenesis protein CcmG/thiol:disulfide interchange protein DsbE